MSVTRPVVGITAYAEPIVRGVWQPVPSVFVASGYTSKVVAAGGIPMVIPPVDAADDDWAQAVLDRLDALIIAGGADIDPQLYGEAAHPAAQEFRPERDACEIALARAAVQRDLPLLGICRGMQVMAVAAGGSVDQHLPDLVGHEGHSPTPGAFAEHPVVVRKGTGLHAILGDEVVVPTYHHQGVRTHPGYVAAADASDGVLEAIEDPTARWRFGVQWHPEAGDDPRLFDALVHAALR
ncbi:gamma-glutamyl-gamma-aminobutyrate hydrolase family protein [Rudaeicoccus suwonensis]|uniref:Putative glutamine amidotransferase n=1 Tax=Rudaeicoccus suwonensis TaxID=657409 RepID=A0A561E9B4_9MICO|nr:gamma-glutamyl-gamma-aminobutyrate hydrolase family protein [Rudaeicoccus suwonensis]TWE12202.1 putative glutamine amidotransferase [Rudaeicoccus suwonensis]